MQVVELREEMELGGKEVKEVKDVINFHQFVRISVDTDVDTHFLVSLSRTSTVMELRELVKAAHRHCYPDRGDVDIGKLAVPIGDYGYYLPDFLLIGQVYDRNKGKVFAEVENHDPASNSSQGLSRMQALSFKSSSTQKKIPLLAPQPFGNVAGQISTNTSGFVPLLDPRGAVGEPRALLRVELNPCEPQIELLVAKLQKEEIDEDGNCYLLSQEPLDGVPSKVREVAVGSFERIVGEEDERLVERLSTAVNDGDVDVSGAIELSKDESSNLDGMNNVLKDVNAAASSSHMNRADDLDANYLSLSGSKRKKKKALQIHDLTISENRSEAENDAMLGVEDKEEMCSDEVRKKERQVGTHLVIGSGLEGSGNNGLEVGREAKSSLPEDAGVPPSFGQKGKKLQKLKEEKVPEQEKTRKRKEKERIQKPVKETEQEESEREEEPEQEKGKKQKKGKLKEEIEKQEREQQEREKEEREKEERGKQEREKQERELEQERKKQERERKKQEKELKKEKEKQEKERKKQERELKQEKEKQEKEKQEREKEEREKEETEKEETERQERELEQERKKQEKERKKQEREKQERELEQERKKEDKERKKQARELKKEKEKQEREQEKQERELKKEQEKQERELEQEKREKKEKMEKREEEKKEKKQKKGKKQKQIIDEITPLDCASLNPLVEESDKEPEQENYHLGAAAVSPNLSQHIHNDEKESDGVPDIKENRVKKRGSTAAAAVAYDVRSRMGDEDSGRPSASDSVKDEISESGTPQREAQVLRGTSGEDMIQDGAVTIGSENIDDKVLLPKTSLFGDGNDVETRPSYQGGTETSPQMQGTEVGSVESKKTPSPSRPLSYTRAGRGAPSQTRSIASSRDVTKSKQIGGTNKNSESQSSQCSEKATQQSEGINLGSEVTGAWLRRSRLESDAGHVDQSQVTEPGEVARSSSTGESSGEADQTEVRSYQDVSRKEDEILEALYTNHASRTVKSSEKHASTSAKRTDGIKNDSLEFFSQDQSFHVAPTQVEKSLSGSSTEDNSDDSDNDSDEDTDKLKKQTAGNLNVTQQGPGESKESSDESGDLARPGLRGFPSLTTRTAVPSVSRMTGNGGSQSFKRRASGVAAEIEAKFAHFIESQGGLDEIMGITLGQRKRSLPVDSSTQVGLGARSTGSMATPFGSPLDLALNTQESVKNSPMALDIAQPSQFSAGKFLTPQFKVPKPVPVGTVCNSAAATVPLAGREVPKAKAPKELRLKRKETTPQVDKKTQTGSLLVKHNNDIPLPALESLKETFLGDKDAAKRKPKSVGNSSPSLRPETLKVTFLDDLNAAEKRSSVGKSSEKTKRSEEEHQDSQFMIVNNTDHILEQDRRDKKVGSNGETKESFGLNEDGSLVSLKSGKNSKEGKVKIEIVETDVFGSLDMFVPDTSGKKRRKESEKERSRKKRTKFLPQELDGKEVTILPENSVERSARETEELYVQLEKANRGLWLKSNSISSFRKEDEKIGNRDPAADLNDTEGAEGEDVAQSRLVGREIETDDSKVVGDAPVDEGDPADRDPSPELCAGTTEASDREDSVFQSQDEKAETSQQDVFDYVSGDELPTKVLSKSDEKKKSERMEELSGRAVQRVLEDEMLHVVDTVDVPAKKSRKSASPINWTVRMRGLSPTALAPSVLGGTVSSNNAAEFHSNPNIMPKWGGGAFGEGGAQAKPRKVTKSTSVRAPKPVVPRSTLSAAICPMGCGKVYPKKTSAYYTHRAKCLGAPV